ncbi:uncharacterized protein LOC143010523 [Genypterus blacodes]|uniref:uncharacterized protein LOC143010523 n=1 Tax=Genypterus blacodes TaxID=154954 RepID=UPI003F77406E
MDGDVLSLSSSSSSSFLPPAASAAASAAREKSDSSPLQSQQGPKSTGDLWTEDVSPVGQRLLSGEQVTLITESMSVTSSDQEKLLLLNKNTELRRVNKELMKLNDDWDQVYRSATFGLQHRLEAVELENSTIKQLNNRLLLKVECEQAAKEYYQQALIQELKKNQDLQEYIRVLEARVHHTNREHTPAKQGSLNAAVHSSVPCPTGLAPGGPALTSSHDSTAFSSPSCFFPPPPNLESGLEGKSQSSSVPLGEVEDSQQEMRELRKQLEALRYQTQIYEAEYQTEHKDHKHTLQENRRLRKKREETRQQVALLQEQLKLYEDDFRRERSDKQMLQRLLKKSAPSKEPVLIHRCNNEQQPLEGNNGTERGEQVYSQLQRKQHHPLCPKHNRDKGESA